MLFFICLVIYDPATYLAPAWSFDFLGDTFFERVPTSSSICFFFGLLLATLKYRYLSLSFDFFSKVLLLDLCLLLVLSLSLLSTLVDGLLFLSSLMILLLSSEEKFFDLLLFLL